MDFFLSARLQLWATWHFRLFEGNSINVVLYAEIYEKYTFECHWCVVFTISELNLGTQRVSTAGNKSVDVREVIS